MQRLVDRQYSTPANKVIGPNNRLRQCVTDARLRSAAIRQFFGWRSFN
jgi:hypothetical protein